MQTPSLATVPFVDAAVEWLQTRKPYLRERTFGAYGEHIKALSGFFGQLRLAEIHIGHLREYQLSRSNRACSMRINGELGTLSQILQAAGLWAAIEEHYERLPSPRWTPPRVMTPEQKEHLFKIASQNPNWAVAYWASILSVNTTAAGCEIRGLKLENLDLAEGVLYIPDDSVKNEYRARVIPLNADAYQAASALLKLAKERGCWRPEHYLIPFRVKKGTYDPLRPTKGWRTAFSGMRSAADIPWLRPHDLRHQAITELLEHPAISEETVKSIAGHVSQKILNHYSHIRIERKREALDFLGRKPAASCESTGGKLRRFSK